MPVYNGERYLREAVDSILAQTFQDFEFIITDDGSTDATADILSEYAERDSRIRLVTNSQNIGLTPNLNKGLELARGEFIARMDADDISLPSRLQRQYDFLKSNSGFVLIGTGYIEINHQGSQLKKVTEAAEDWEFEWVSQFRPPIAHPTAMFRADLIRSHGLSYDESYPVAQDFDLWIRILQYGRGMCLPEPLVLYRMHDENISSMRTNEQKETHVRIATHHLVRRYPSLERNEKSVRDLLYLFLGTKPLESQDLPGAINVLIEIFEKFQNRHNLGSRQTARIRALISRILLRALSRYLLARNPYSIIILLWAARVYWITMIGECGRFLYRRLRARVGVTRKISPALK